MEQELFKNMYRQIHLDKEQKDRMWQCLETAADGHVANDHTQKNMGKRFSFSARTAACVGMLLVSGMTVFAANEFSLMDRLANAMKLLTQNEQVLTEEQQNIYAQYGTSLDNEVVRTNGTFRLEAALYDGNYLFIPFRYIMNPDTAGYENITAGFTFDEATMWNSKLLAGYRQDQADLWYGISQGTKQARGISGYIMVLNPKIEEDGVLTGSLLLSVAEDETFSKGDVIQIVEKAEQPEVTGKIRRLENGENADGLEVFGNEELGYFVLEEDYTVPDEILTEFTLENPVEQHSVSIPAKQAEMLEQLGLSVEELTVSSISIHFSGILGSTVSGPYSGSVMLKDGSTVGFSASGGTSSGIGAANTEKPFSWCRLFDAPIQVEEIEGIRIYQGTSEVWIPVEW
ncbi:MAG: DUF4179 domain-containing protein [Lachnospiraceae bacterium]|nr:DUF4179 domain-containing protein [Lachnospiraceae bacterium]